MESKADPQPPEALQIAQITIDCLPYEVLHRIIAFVPKKYRLKCALVNSIFYAIVCKLDESDKIICLTNRHLLNASIFNSIITTRRRLKKVKMDLSKKNIDKIPVLLQVHGTSIKAMELKILIVGLVEGDKFFEILKSLPNLEMLLIAFNKAAISCCKVQDKATILPKLKHLKILFNGDANLVGNLFDFISENTIRQLQIFEPYWNGLESLVERQEKSLENLTLHFDLLDWPQMFKKMKLKSLTIVNTFNNDTSELNDNLLQIINDHPELEEIKIDEDFETSGDLAEALLKMKHLKSIELIVTDANWNKILQEVGRSQIENIHLDLKDCDEKKLRIFFNQQYSNIKSVEFTHLIKATTEDCNNWKQLTKIRLHQSFKQEHVNLNFILNNLSNLENLDFHEINDIIFISNGNSYPKIKHFKGSSRAPIDLLNALPNLEDLSLSDIKFNVEILRKLATMKISKLEVSFMNQMETLQATDEILQLFKVILDHASLIKLSFYAEELQNFGRDIQVKNRYLDYEVKFKIIPSFLFVTKTAAELDRLSI